MSYSAFADDFLDDFPHLITLTPYTVTGNGTRVPGTPHTYHARIEQAEKPIYSATGAVVFSTGVVYAHPKAVDGTVLTALTPSTTLTLPSGATPRLLTVGSEEDEAGIVYWALRF